MQVSLPLCQHTGDRAVCIDDLILKSCVVLSSPGQYLTANDLAGYAFSAGTMLSELTSQGEPKCLNHFLIFLLFPLRSAKGRNFSQLTSTFGTGGV